MCVAITHVYVCAGGLESAGGRRPGPFHGLFGLIDVFDFFGLVAGVLTFLFFFMSLIIFLLMCLADSWVFGGLDVCSFKISLLMCLASFMDFSVFCLFMDCSVLFMGLLFVCLM